MADVAVIGMDIGKTTFHLIAVDASGAIQWKKKFSRSQLMRHMEGMPGCLVGMEACCGAHHLARELAELGHDVRLMAPQFEKPFLKFNKNDYLDAEAIAEAVQRPTMLRAGKSGDQLDLQALHRVRERLVSRRTAVINQIRAFLLDRGIVFRADRRHMAREMPLLFIDERSTLSPRMRMILQQLWGEWRGLEADIVTVTKEIEMIVAADEGCRRLLAIPGSDRWWPRRWSRRSQTAPASNAVAILLHGLALCPGSIPPAASRRCSVCRSAAIVTCEDCSFMAHGRPACT